MSARSEESAVERLRKQAERAIAAAQGRRTVEPLLERIVSLAPDGSEASVFAHRHLAEYRIEDHPWRALLHLRKVAIAQPDDDVVHALMGLSHALLANFRAAVGSYRRAIALAQRNPWYHHNLGHLLDVALDQPGSALRHLEFAHRAAHPPEHEIAASLAHCLARLGRIDEARTLATAAVAAEPRNREHKQLLAWVERGAPEEGGDPRTKRAAPEQRANTSRAGAPSPGGSRAGSSRGVAPRTIGRAETSGEDRGARRPPTARGAGPRSEARSTDARSSEPRSSDARSTDARSTDARSTSARSTDTRSTDARSSDARSSEPRSSDARSADARSTSARSSSARGDVPPSSLPRPREPRAGDPRVPDRRTAEPRDHARNDTRVRTEPGVRVRGDLDPVLPLIDRVMREGGFTPEHVARARRLWVDYSETRGAGRPGARDDEARSEERAPRAPKPDVCAAAIEYAIARLHGLDGVTRASVARRYGVSARSVSERFDDIQVVLALKPDDPRYARC